jgi:hypothetical protein
MKGNMFCPLGEYMGPDLDKTLALSPNQLPGNQPCFSEFEIPCHGGNDGE